MTYQILSKHKTVFIIIFLVVIIKLLLFGWAWLNFNSVTSSENNWLNIWDRWDSGVYKTIATSGYEQTVGMKMDWWAFLSHFPPLYPIMIYIVSLLGVPIPSSGILVSFLSIIIASVILYELVLLEFKNQQSAVLAVLFLNLFPTSYFTISIYSESLFLLLTIASFYCLRKERFFWAGLLAGGAILTRNVGIVLIPIYFIYSFSAFFKNRRSNLNLLCLCLLPIFAMVIYIGINKFYFGDYFYFLHEKLSFNTTKHFIFPFKETYHDLLAISQNSNLLNESFMTTRGWNAIFVLFAFLVTTLGIRKVKWEYTLYSFSSIFLYSSLSWGISNARYVFATFPMFLVLSSIENKWLQVGIMGVFFVMLLYFSKIFTSGAWAF